MDLHSLRSLNSCHIRIFHECSMLWNSGVLGQIKKISVFRVMGLKILGRVGTHIFFNYFF